MTPGQPPTPDQAQPIQETQKPAETIAEKPGKNAIAPPNPEAEYAKDVATEARLGKQIAEAQEQVDTDHAQITALRESMGLPPDERLETTGDLYQDSLQAQREAAEKIVKDKERDLLNVPDGEGKKPELSETQIMPMAGQETEAIEKMEKQAREQFVLDFIKVSIEKMLADFKVFLDESTNAEQAKKLIKIKTETSLQVKAKDFIENGGEPDFGFEAKIMGAEFDTAEGKPVKYVTEFDIAFDDGTNAINTDEQPGGELIDLQARQEMKKAADEGSLEEIQDQQAT